jgi:two-component system sensor histidine kinase DesK
MIRRHQERREVPTVTDVSATQDRDRPEVGPGPAEVGPGPAEVGPAPAAPTVAGPQPWEARTGPRRFGWVFASVWLVYLVDVLQAALANPDRLRGAIGTTTVLLFAVIHVVMFIKIRTLRLTGRLPMMMPARWLALTIQSGLFVVVAVTTGQKAVAMTVFLSVMAMFLLPLRLALAYVVALIVVVELSAFLVPGWQVEHDLSFQIVLTAFVMWGVMQMVQRNIELAQAQAQIAEMAVSQERNRFARDLHDILGHSLTVITVKAELAGRLVELDPGRAGQEIADVERLARDALADVRSAVSGYREANLATELVSARAALDAAGIEAELPNAVDAVAGERSELFGWAVREGVTNVIRHSGARRCRVVVRPDEIRIEDDGCLRPEPAADRAVPTGNTVHTGNGVNGLRERAEALGARLTVGRSDLGGFLLVVGW